MLVPEKVLGPNQSVVQQQLDQWVRDVMNETGIQKESDVFCGFEPFSTSSSAVLTLSKYNDNDPLLKHVSFLEECRLWLARTAFPIAMMHSTSLQCVGGLNYMRDHVNLKAFMRKYIFEDDQMQSDSSLVLLLTQSPVSHLSEAIKATVADFSGFSPRVLQLAELTSERQLASEVKLFLTATSIITSKEVLIIQCDPIACRPSLINHARHVCVQQYAAIFDYSGSIVAFNKVILFIVHLPPGIQKRQRWFVLFGFPPVIIYFFITFVLLILHDVGLDWITAALGNHTLLMTCVQMRTILTLLCLTRILRMNWRRWASLMCAISFLPSIKLLCVCAAFRCYTIKSLRLKIRSPEEFAHCLIGCSARSSLI